MPSGVDAAEAVGSDLARRCIALVENAVEILWMRCRDAAPLSDRPEDSLRAAVRSCLSCEAPPAAIRSYLSWRQRCHAKRGR
jgi:hypothetical protein